MGIVGSPGRDKSSCPLSSAELSLDDAYIYFVKIVIINTKLLLFNITSSPEYKQVSNKDKANMERVGLS